MNEDDIIIDNVEFRRVYETMMYSIREELYNENLIELTHFTNESLSLYLDAVEQHITPYLLAKMRGWDMSDPVLRAVIDIANELYKGANQKYFKY